ncbi:hypothetical protein HDV00_005257 [Rhizophlyctis rosea]|nr:hypothetical protein HDV00_005257 [Rhizophlyctis rosea]
MVTENGGATETQARWVRPAGFVNEKVDNAERLGIKVWNISRLLAVLKTCLPTDTTANLQDRLRDERIYGVSTARGTNSVRLNFASPFGGKGEFRPFEGRYLLVEDATQVHRAVIVKEYDKEREGKKVPWPRIYFKGGRDRKSVFEVGDGRGYASDEDDDDDEEEGEGDVEGTTENKSRTPNTTPKRQQPVPHLHNSTSTHPNTGTHQHPSIASGLISGSAALLPRKPLPMNPNLTKLDHRTVALDPRAQKEKQTPPSSKTAKPKRKSSYRMQGKGFYNRAGFCENCNVKYESFMEHVRSRGHREWAGKEHFFRGIDGLIEKLGRKRRRVDDGEVVDLCTPEEEVVGEEEGVGEDGREDGREDGGEEGGDEEGGEDVDVDVAPTEVVEVEKEEEDEEEDEEEEDEKGAGEIDVHLDVDDVPTEKVGEVNVGPGDGAEEEEEEDEEEEDEHEEKEEEDGKEEKEEDETVDAEEQLATAPDDTTIYDDEATIEIDTTIPAVDVTTHTKRDRTPSASPPPPPPASKLRNDNEPRKPPHVWVPLHLEISHAIARARSSSPAPRSGSPVPRERGGSVPPAPPGLARGTTVTPVRGLWREEERKEGSSCGGGGEWKGTSSSGLKILVRFPPRVQKGGAGMKRRRSVGDGAGRSKRRRSINGWTEGERSGMEGVLEEDGGSGEMEGRMESDVHDDGSHNSTTKSHPSVEYGTESTQLVTTPLEAPPTPDATSTATTPTERNMRSQPPPTPITAASQHASDVAPPTSMSGTSVSVPAGQNVRLHYDWDSTSRTGCGGLSDGVGMKRSSEGGHVTVRKRRRSGDLNVGGGVEGGSEDDILTIGSRGSSETPRGKWGCHREFWRCVNGGVGGGSSPWVGGVVENVSEEREKGGESPIIAMRRRQGVRVGRNEVLSGSTSVIGSESEREDVPTPRMGKENVTPTPPRVRRGILVGNPGLRREVTEVVGGGREEEGRRRGRDVMRIGNLVSGDANSSGIGSEVGTPKVDEPLRSTSSIWTPGPVSDISEEEEEEAVPTPEEFVTPERGEGKGVVPIPSTRWRRRSGGEGCEEEDGDEGRGVGGFRARLVQHGFDGGM